MLILASQSPRRRELLTAAGFEFVVRPSDVPEQRAAHESAEEYVARLSSEKARAAERAPGDIVLAADTVVVVDGEVLEKPRSNKEAASMLRKLSGRRHVVLTGICLLHDGGELRDTGRTVVEFDALTEGEIADYVASGEPRDKAGAYAVQGLAAKFVRGIEGCHFNVVGLPVSLVYRRLRQLSAPEE